jgi:hypothetical protein
LSVPRAIFDSITLTGEDLARSAATIWWDALAKDFGHEDAGLATPETLVSIVENFGIRTFLGSGNKRYLVGPKGSGKTLILLRKAIDQRRHEPSNDIEVAAEPFRRANRRRRHESQKAR